MAWAGNHLDYIKRRKYLSALGLSDSASDEEIRKTYKRLALTCHPDKNPGDDRAVQKFQDLSEAYTALIKSDDDDDDDEYDEYYEPDMGLWDLLDFFFQMRGSPRQTYRSSSRYSYSQDDHGYDDYSSHKTSYSRTNGSGDEGSKQSKKKKKKKSKKEPTKVATAEPPKLNKKQRIAEEKRLERERAELAKELEAQRLADEEKQRKKEEKRKANEEERLKRQEEESTPSYIGIDIDVKKETKPKSNDSANSAQSKPSSEPEKSKSRRKREAKQKRRNRGKVEESTPAFPVPTSFQNVGNDTSGGYWESINVDARSSQSDTFSKYSMKQSTDTEDWDSPATIKQDDDWGSSSNQDDYFTQQLGGVKVTPSPSQTSWGPQVKTNYSTTAAKAPSSSWAPITKQSKYTDHSSSKPANNNNWPPKPNQNSWPSSGSGSAKPNQNSWPSSGSGSAKPNQTSWPSSGSSTSSKAGDLDTWDSMDSGNSKGKGFVPKQASVGSNRAGELDTWDNIDSSSTNGKSFIPKQHSGSAGSSRAGDLDTWEPIDATGPKSKSFIPKQQSGSAGSSRAGDLDIREPVEASGNKSKSFVPKNAAPRFQKSKVNLASEFFPNLNKPQSEFATSGENWELEEDNTFAQPESVGTKRVPAPPPTNVWQRRTEIYQGNVPRSETEEEEMLRAAIELSKKQAEEEQEIRKLMGQIELTESEPLQSVIPSESSHMIQDPLDDYDDEDLEYYDDLEEDDETTPSVNQSETTPSVNQSETTPPVHQVETPPPRHFQTETSPPRHHQADRSFFNLVETTPIRQAEISPTRHHQPERSSFNPVATTPTRQVATTPSRHHQAERSSFNPVATTPTRQLATTPSRQVETTPSRHHQAERSSFNLVETTPVRQAERTVFQAEKIPSVLEKTPPQVLEEETEQQILKTVLPRMDDVAVYQKGWRSPESLPESPQVFTQPSLRRPGVPQAPPSFLKHGGLDDFPVTPHDEELLKSSLPRMDDFERMQPVTPSKNLSFPSQQPRQAAYNAFPSCNGASLPTFLKPQTSSVQDEELEDWGDEIQVKKQALVSNINSRLHEPSVNSPSRESWTSSDQSHPSPRSGRLYERQNPKSNEDLSSEEEEELVVLARDPAHPIHKPVPAFQKPVCGVRGTVHSVNQQYETNGNHANGNHPKGNHRNFSNGNPSNGNTTIPSNATNSADDYGSLLQKVMAENHRLMSMMPSAVLNGPSFQEQFPHSTSNIAQQFLGNPTAPPPTNPPPVPQETHPAPPPKLPTNLAFSSNQNYPMMMNQYPMYPPSLLPQYPTMYQQYPGQGKN